MNRSVFSPRLAFRLIGSALAVALLAEPAAATGAKEAAAGLPACVVAYAASLKRIAAESLPSIGADGAGAQTAVPPQPDVSLPGMPLFVPPSRKRSAAEVSALTAAVALARSKGRSTSVAGAGSDADRAWIAARLKEDLGDYLNQAPTPYLCSNVPAYLDTLRRFAARLGPIGDRRPEWVATQRQAAEASVKAAEAAILRAKANAPQAVAQTDLRPGPDLARTEAPDAAGIADEAAIVAAVDRLIGEARAAGLVSEPPMPQMTGATVPTPPSPSRPVLAKLVEARPLVVSARPLIRDRDVRLKLLAAFADIEMLDYLTKAQAETPDPLASAIGRTIDRVGEAQKTDCICSD